ncbi:MAG: alpha-galactosidase, partial [Actinomycetota bacterium]|nr:alpha-galactosidase [Actinomycetota bacterium]
ELQRAVGPGAAVGSNHAVTARSVPLVPTTAYSWLGRPGLAGHRLGTGDGRPPAAGRDWSPAFRTETVVVDPRSITVEAADRQAGLLLRTEIAVLSGGSLRLRHRLTNSGTEPYVVDALEVTVPVADRAAEIFDLTGRWGRERSPQRHPVVDGVFLREGRTGKTGLESVTSLVVGVPGFGFERGDVWAVHVAWSGNTRHFVQRQPGGLVTLGGGELLLPGETVLASGESYTTPWVHLAATEHGLDGLAHQFHDYARSLPAHPREPRPVVLNVWEAVYFDHDLGRLAELATLAAEIGIDRFVLDDGWFGGRRHDAAGLGDWVVSSDVWPDGLTSLIDRVADLGMQFGLWFEPEMVNADSDLYRAHPEWVLAVPGRPATEFRNQLVLDLGREDVRAYLFRHLDALLARHPIRYVKWDHNRPLMDGASTDSGHAPGVHRQTLGFYDLLDRLRAAHPGVDWESCASGGGRIDLAVLERVQRVWTSDMTDALSRQSIQRWTAQLVAPEYLGAHISAPVNHQTGRTLSLDFRAATAFFGDLGVEWDISAATAAERARLAEWIALYKRHRRLLHSGRIVRFDSAEPAIWTYGVIAADRGEAVLAYVQLEEFVRDPLPWRVPGLDPDRRYTARLIVAAEDPTGTGYRRPPWRGDGLTLSGSVLAAFGLPAPPRHPQSS